MKVMIVSLMSLLFVSNVWAQGSELAGICEREKTAAQCKVLNKTPYEIVQIGWLLEGSNVDYGDDVSVNLKPGKSVVVSNAKGEDNCLFTGDTGIYAYYANNVNGEPQFEISFDKKDQCTIVFTE